LTKIKEYISNRTSFTACILLLAVSTILWAFVSHEKPPIIYLIGDSTVTDYSLEDDYEDKRYPQMGWGQVFHEFLDTKGLFGVRHIIKGERVVVDDRAKGGRSTRTFFQEGRWRSVYASLKKDDVVMMQFGHNDQSIQKVLRYVNVEGYKEFIRLFVNQTREKSAIPIIITPVNRNYPWINGQLVNCHGEYPNAAKEIAKELEVPVIDLTQLSIKHFTERGEEYVTNNYFMNLPSEKFKAYPEGMNDNTHFQPEGAMEVAKLVFEAMKDLNI
jgi:lysophospholipase L1-like esterase